MTRYSEIPEDNIEGFASKRRFDDDDDYLPKRMYSPKIQSNMTIFLDTRSPRVVTKIYKERPLIEIADDNIVLEDNDRVLDISAWDGSVGISLAGNYPNANISLFDSRMENTDLIRRNVQANHQVQNVVQVDGDVLSNQKGTYNKVIYSPPLHTSNEVTASLLAQGFELVGIDGEVYCMTHKKRGAESHFKIMQDIFGVDNVEIVGRGNGGYRVIRGIKRNELPQTQKRSLQKQVTISVLGFDFTVETEPSLFSQNGLDIGTRLLLETLEPQLTNFEEMLDIGCGWGAIGLVSALTNPKGHVVMVDVDSRATQLAIRNAELLGVSDQVSVIATNNLRRDIDETFDLILSNPPYHTESAVLKALFKDARSLLLKGKEMYLVVEKTYVQKMTDILIDVFGNYKYEVENQNNFWIISTKK